METPPVAWAKPGLFFYWHAFRSDIGRPGWSVCGIHEQLGAELVAEPVGDRCGACQRILALDAARDRAPAAGS